MITRLRGMLLEQAPLAVTVECAGVGYEVHVPVTTLERLPQLGAEVTLHTHQVFFQDGQALYGFASREERDFFRLVAEKVSGIGPRLALALLSKLSLPVLRQAIAEGDTKLLASSPGIGKKTAERLVLELRDKLGFAAGEGALPAGGPRAADPVADAVAALVALGYSGVEADKSVRQAQQGAGDAPLATEELVRRALRG